MIPHKKFSSFTIPKGKFYFLFFSRKKFTRQKWKFELEKKGKTPAVEWKIEIFQTNRIFGGIHALLLLHHAHNQMLHDLIHPHKISLYSIFFLSSRRNCRMIRSFPRNKMGNGVFIEYFIVRIHTHRPCHWLSFDIPPGFCLENLFFLILKMIRKFFDQKWRRAFLCWELANDIDAANEIRILLQIFKCFSTKLPLAFVDSSQKIFSLTQICIFMMSKINFPK